VPGTVTPCDPLTMPRPPLTGGVFDAHAMHWMCFCLSIGSGKKKTVCIEDIGGGGLPEGVAMASDPSCWLLQTKCSINIDHVGGT